MQFHFYTDLYMSIKQALLKRKQLTHAASTLNIRSRKGFWMCSKHMVCGHRLVGWAECHVSSSSTTTKRCDAELLVWVTVVCWAVLLLYMEQKEAPMYPCNQVTACGTQIDTQHRTRFTAACHQGGRWPGKQDDVPLSGRGPL